PTASPAHQRAARCRGREPRAGQRRRHTGAFQPRQRHPAQRLSRDHGAGAALRRGARRIAGLRAGPHAAALRYHVGGHADRRHRRRQRGVRRGAALHGHAGAEAAVTLTREELRKLLLSAPGKPANVDFYASTMKVELALLHEEDLLRFLADLRASGNAYYSVKQCLITRTGQAATGASIVPRLRADCEIDLITIIDRAAKR